MRLKKELLPGCLMLLIVAMAGRFASVDAATIRYALTNWNISPPTNTLRILPISSASLDGSTATPRLALRLFPKNGMATNSLPAGTYRLEIQGTQPVKRFVFVVPNSTNFFEVTSLITSSNNPSAIPALSSASVLPLPENPAKRVLYVHSTLGSDESGDGSLNNPFQTIGYWAEDNPQEAIYDIAGQQIFFPTGALAQARGGDTILLLPGTHTNIFVALWKTNDPTGVNLVGSGSDNTFFYVDSSIYDDILVGEPIQPGNNSIIRDFAVVNPHATNGGATWNGILGDAGGPSLYSHIGDYFTPAGMTNVTVMNLKGNGFYDGVFFSGIYCPYNVRFINCEFSSIWDVFVCQNISNYVTAGTESYNCTYHAERQFGNTNPLHAAALFGGNHEFFNCTFSVRETNDNGSAFGLFSQDSSLALGGFRTNQVALYNCRFVDSSSAGTSLDVMNVSAMPARSQVAMFGGKSRPSKTKGVSGLYGDLDNLNLTGATLTSTSTNLAPFGYSMDFRLVPSEGSMRTNGDRRATITLGFTADFTIIQPESATIAIHSFQPGSNVTNVYTRTVVDPTHNLSIEDNISFRLSPGDVWYYTADPVHSFATKVPPASSFIFE